MNLNHFPMAGYIIRVIFPTEASDSNSLVNMGIFSKVNSIYTCPIMSYWQPGRMDLMTL